MKLQRSNIIDVCCYAPGDGTLAFVCQYSCDNINGRRTQATNDEPTQEECLKLLPLGWTLDKQNGMWRGIKNPPVRDAI